MIDDGVIVIGSGPTGAMATATLVGRGVDVLLLDAGARAPRGLLVKAAGNTLYRRMGWSEYSTDRLDPSNDDMVDWVSSLSLGGLSNYWTAAVPRFAPEDFTDGARLDERYRWPITYEDLVPFYEVAERHLTITADGPIDRVPTNVRRYDRRLPADWQQIASAANEHGHAVGVLPMAKGRPWMVSLRGTEFSSYYCVLAPLLESPHLQLVTNAEVVRLDHSAGSGRVESVTYLDRHSGERRTVRGRAVVVAAGAIDTTTLLLRSRSPDFPTGLGDSAGLLGRYLHDHPREWWTATPAKPLSALSHPVYIARSGYAESEPLIATSLTLGLSSQLERLRTYYRGRSSSFGVQVFGTMIPTPDVGVSISDDVADDGGPCHPRVDLRYDAVAVTNMVNARRRLRDVFADAGVDLTIPGPFHPLRPGSSVHYGGSVRMHADPQFGVLDGWNRMHDVPNVVVCDSSCFTTGPEKNPTLTAMAIAARAADHLADSLSAGDR